MKGVRERLGVMEMLTIFLFVKMIMSADIS